MTQNNESKFEVTEYNATAAGLADISKRTKDVTYDLTTISGMESAKSDRKELKTLRINLEAKRVELKAPALKRSRAIDGEAKLIEVQIRALEEPIDQQIKAVEAKAKEEKEAKLNATREKTRQILERIEKLKAIPATMEFMPSVKVIEAIESIEGTKIDEEGFGEYLVLAQEAFNETMVALIRLKDEKVVTELEAAEVEEKRLADIEADRVQRLADQKILDDAQKKLDDDRKEFEESQAETNRINDIKSLIACRYHRQQHGMNLPADDLRTAIFELKNNVCTQIEFAEFHREADCAREDLYRAYEKILVDVEAKEAEELRVETERIAKVAKEQKVRDDNAAKLLAESIENDKKRKKAEKEKKAAERAKLVAEAKCENTTLAFGKIIEIINDEKVGEETKLNEVLIIAEANI
jgi:hypothetical protein